MTTRHFGPIPTVQEGQTFASRYELRLSGVHLPLQAGISGSQQEGADSIVLSGGYEDDEDRGDIILYTGHGGRDLDTGKQVADQLLVRQNLALAQSPCSKRRESGSSVSRSQKGQEAAMFFVEGYEILRNDGREKITVKQFRRRRNEGKACAVVLLLG